VAYDRKALPDPGDADYSADRASLGAPAEAWYVLNDKPLSIPFEISEADALKAIRTLTGCFAPGSVLDLLERVIAIAESSFVAIEGEGFPTSEADKATVVEAKAALQFLKGT